MLRAKLIQNGVTIGLVNVNVQAGARSSQAQPVQADGSAAASVYQAPDTCVFRLPLGASIQPGAIYALDFEDGDLRTLTITQVNPTNRVVEGLLS